MGLERRLVGRVREQRRLAAMEQRAIQDRACAVLFVGDPGVGKTALLERFASSAAAPTVLPGGQHRSRRSADAAGLFALPFAGRPMPRPTASRLDELWRREDFDPAAAAAAVLACAAAGGRTPVTYLVDDVDLIDPRAYATLVHVVAEATSEPITVVATSRSPLPDWPARTVPLRPLTHDAMVELLTGFGFRRPVAADLATRTAGNPLAARAAAVALTDDQRSGADALPAQLSVPARLVAAARHELDAMPDGARVATLASASSAVAEGTSSLRAASLIAAASPTERRLAQRAGAGSVDGPAVLLQLAAAAEGADGDLFAALTASARRCLEDRDVSGAVDLLVAAGEIAPRREDAYATWHRAAVGSYLTAENRRALELVGALRSLAEQEVFDVRLDRLEGLCGLHVHGLESSVEQLEHAAARAARAGEADAALTLLLIAGVFSLYGCRMDDLEEFADKARSLPIEDPLAVATVAVFSASADLYARVDPSLVRQFEPVLVAASAAGDGPDDAIPDLDLDPPRSRFFAGLLCLTDERWDAARRLLSATTDHDTAAGWTALVGLDVGWYAEVLWRQGEWAEALTLARSAMQVPGSRLGRSRIWIDAFLAKAELLVGRPAAANRHRAAVEADTGSPLAIPLAQLAARAGTGRALLGEGSTDDALVQLLGAEEIGRKGVGHPGLVWWRADLVEALAAAGHRKDALAAADELTARLGDDPPPVLHGRSLRAQGLAQGGRRGARLLGRAVAVHETGGSPFELARSLLALADARAALGDEDDAGSQPARRAQALFDRLGANAFSDRARSIGRADEQSVRLLLAQLTPREAEVARMVAAGATNQDVAAELGVSPKTVGFHLEAVFRKLHVNRRSQLAALITAR